MKLILKQHLSGTKGSFEIGEEIEVTDNQAVAFIEKGIATFKTQKELEAFKKKIEKIKADKAEAEAKANAILKQSAIQNELNQLYLEVVQKEAELNGEVLSDEEKLQAVEAIAKRDAATGKKTGKK